MRVVSLLLGPALVFAACGGAANVGESADSAAPDASEAADAAPAGGEAGQPTGELPSSLASFFGYGDDFDPALEQARYERQELEAQQLIRQCMAQQGWEYTPFVPDFGEEVFFGPGDDLSREEWVAQYGFGISTTFTEQFDQDFSVEENLDPTDDPNFIYRDSLTPAEQIAYDRALYGSFDFDESDIEYGEDGNPIFPEFEPSGCFDEAYGELFGGFGGEGGEIEVVYEELGPLYEELFQRIEADPRVVELKGAWSGCMGEAGYTFAGQDDMYMSIEERMSGFYELAYGTFDEQEFAESADEVAVTIVEFSESGAPSLTPEQEADLADLNDYEIAVATADLECSAGYEDVYQRVSQDYEADFIEANIGLLTQVRELEGR